MVAGDSQDVGGSRNMTGAGPGAASQARGVGAGAGGGAHPLAVDAPWLLENDACEKEEGATRLRNLKEGAQKKKKKKKMPVV